MKNYSTTVPARLDDEEEEKAKAQPSIQVDKHLFEARTVLITGPVNQEMARDICSRLLALAQVSNDPITVIVSSPGGHVESGDMIHDTIKFISPEVRILGMGWVASAGALIYVSVPKDKRFCTPNTRFLLHQPSGGAGGMATDIEIQAREIIKMRDRLNKSEGALASEAAQSKLATSRLKRAIRDRDSEVADLASQLLACQKKLEDARRGLGRDATNLEYVKNLLVQYFSLRQNSSEQASLVPVLASLLHCSPEETRALWRSVGVEPGN